MRSENQDLKSRINKLEHRSHDTMPMNQDEQLENYDFEQHCREIQAGNTELDKFVKDFDKRCDLVESYNHDLIERLDSCQQNVAKIRQKNEGFESQLTSLHQRLNNFGIQDNNMKDNETIHPQQLAQDDTNQNLLKTVKTDLADNMNTPKEQFHNKNDGCTIIEEALCKPCENQILLSTDEIQYGLFDVCDKYKVIVMKEKSKLILFDYQKQIDERPWGEFGRNNFATCIHWCSFLDCFLILYRFGLHTLSLKVNPTTSQIEFDCLTQIKSIRAYSLQFGRTDQNDKALELLRVITTSPNLPDYLFLNRGYRRLESVNTNSWKVMRGWSKQDLDYGNQDEIGLITCSYDGSYLA
ncbi:unnamed protein product, partial [Adineta steineri]